MTSAARAAALLGYFGLFALLMAWYTIIAPPAYLPVSIVLVLLVGPLLFPLRGILHARPYTHAWASFLALFYFCAGVYNLAGGVQPRWLPWLEIGFSLLFFAGAVLFARWRGRELRISASNGAA